VQIGGADQWHGGHAANGPAQTSSDSPSGAAVDLAAPPGNRLELLKENRAGQHSIRINDQWRICFLWKDSGAELVEIVDYHQG
jgi:proteic killer suppression protein